ncbi:uncharacterized protein CDAR_484081 [Caerostris darwini]|uniref:Uncharacterized protein n=2 Tax=Caerostris TaxID=172845 RepID=A0AAV4TA95_9ARAC|nr:uncharacterized protein CEXT_234991 [Caerostris extrusa]GIY41837.1 uncharacterized protein CDAR_484081 [Caerostris darwini]
MGKPARLTKPILEKRGMPWISEVFIFPFTRGNGRLHACKQLQLLSEDHTIWIALFQVPVRLDKIGSVRRECIIQFAFIFSVAL